MVRTMLRNGSGDLVTAVQLADRTGIVAASAPPGEVSSSQSDASQLVAVADPASAGSALHRVSRQVLFTCAAAGFLIVGWIGGGTFGHRDVAQVPTVAAGVAGVLENDDQSDVPNPPAPQVTPAVPKSATPPPRPVTAKQAGHTKTVGAARNPGPSKVTPPPPASPVAGLGDDLVDRATIMMDGATDGFSQFQWFVDSWNQTDRVQSSMVTSYAWYPASGR